MPSPSSRAEYVALAEELTRKTNFTKEDSARVSALIQMAELTTPTLHEARLHNLRLREEMAPGQPSDREMRTFFAGGRPQGECFEAPGRGTLSYRTYAAIDTTSGADLTPIGFQAEVLSAMKAYDGLFDAARWLYTGDGRVLNFPLGDDTSTNGDAEIIAESTPVDQGANPIFTQLQFGVAPLWSSRQLLYSVQLAQDSGVDLNAYFARIFGLRFARGIGKAFVTALTGAASTGVTTSSPSAIAEGEVFDMCDSLDAAYAQSPTAGWLMSLATYIAIGKIRTTGGQVSFPMQTDSEGYPLLLTKRVYICPAFPAIAGSAKVAAFGDLQRFVVRADQSSFRTLVYKEKFMPTHQLGVQSFWRLEGKLALAGASDEPVALLVMHS